MQSTWRCCGESCCACGAGRTTSSLKDTSICQACGAAAVIVASVPQASRCAGRPEPTRERRRAAIALRDLIHAVLLCPSKDSVMEVEMKLAIALLALTAGFVAASTGEATAVVYCHYINYPVGCVVRPGVVLRPRPVARAVVTP